MSGWRKISIKTYRELSGTLLGTEHTSCKVYQIEDSLFLFFFLAILLHLLHTQAEEETLRTVKMAFTAVSISLQDSWIQQYSTKYLFKNYPWMGTCEEPLPWRGTHYPEVEWKLWPFQHDNILTQILFSSSLILGWKKIFKVNTAAPLSCLSGVTLASCLSLFSVPQAYKVRLRDNYISCLVQTPWYKTQFIKCISQCGSSKILNRIHQRVQEINFYIMVANGKGP